MEKIVGIVGGMGPFATLEFFKKILLQTPVKKDWEHIRLIIDNNVKIPSRTRAILYKEQSPVPSIIESINNLALIGANLIAIPCNSAHYFYKEIVDQINIPWINMIKAVTDEINELSFKKPLILGGYVTTEKKLYDNYLNAPVYLQDEENRFIETLIEEIKLNSELCSESRLRLYKILRAQSNRYDCITLACTEFSLIEEDLMALNIPLIDSTSIYAKKIISLAKN